jgi:hypothetical protein
MWLILVEYVKLTTIAIAFLLLFAIGLRCYTHITGKGVEPIPAKVGLKGMVLVSTVSSLLIYWLLLPLYPGVLPQLKHIFALTMSIFTFGFAGGLIFRFAEAEEGFGQVMGAALGTGYGISLALVLSQ